MAGAAAGGRNKLRVVFVPGCQEAILVRIAIPYTVLIICGLGSLGLILRLWINRRNAKAPRRTLATTLLGVFVLGWIVYRIVCNLVEPAVLRVGMDFDKAQLLLRRQGARPAGFDAVRRRGERQFDYYWLATGPAIHVISQTTPSGRIVESMSVSTYAPKSWKNKSDPEYMKFFHSFVKAEEYDLKTTSVDSGGVQGDDRVPPGGRERAARFQFIFECILLGLLALACILGLGTGAMVSERSIGLIRRILSVVAGLLAMVVILTSYLIQQQIGDVILAIIAWPTIFLGLYTIFAFSVGVALIFRAGHRRIGLRMVCIASLPFFIVLVANVIQ